MGTVGSKDRPGAAPSSQSSPATHPAGAGSPGSFLGPALLAIRMQPLRRRPAQGLSPPAHSCNAYIWLALDHSAPTCPCSRKVPGRRWPSAARLPVPGTEEFCFSQSSCARARWSLGYFPPIPGITAGLIAKPQEPLRSVQDPGRTGALCPAPRFHLYALPAGLGEPRGKGRLAPSCWIIHQQHP